MPGPSACGNVKSALDPEEHPATPWALLAQRELKDPLGFKWVETYVPPPPRQRDNPADPKRKDRNPNSRKPPEMPKL